MDTWLLNRTQAAYDWVFDRTGVYCATLRFCSLLLMLVPELARRGMVDMYTFVFVGIWGVQCGFAYHWQDTKAYAEHNAGVMLWEVSWVRRCALPGMLFGFVAADIMLRHWAWIAWPEGCLMTWSYLSTVTIRDREPPEKEVRGVVYEGNV